MNSTGTTTDEFRPVKVITQYPEQPWWFCSAILVPSGEVSSSLVNLTRWRGCKVAHRTLAAAHKHCDRLERAARKGGAR